MRWLGRSQWTWVGQLPCSCSWFDQPGAHLDDLTQRTLSAEKTSSPASSIRPSEQPPLLFYATFTSMIAGLPLRLASLPRKIRGRLLFYLLNLASAVLPITGPSAAVRDCHDLKSFTQLTINNLKGNLRKRLVPLT